MHLKQIPYSRKHYELLDKPLMQTEYVFDIEVYPNYLLVAFKHLPSGKIFFQEEGFGKTIDRQLLSLIAFSNLLISFNGNGYDMPIFWEIVQGKSIAEIQELSQAIIQTERYRGKVPRTNHIDLIEVAPLKASLKAYAGRLGCKRMQDLPYDPLSYLSSPQARHLKEYCINDLDNTELIWNEIQPQMELRKSMSLQYNQDLRSKSDAQIAEAVISSEVSRLNERPIRRPKVDLTKKIRYKAPDTIQFRDEKLKEVVRRIEKAHYALAGDGSPVLPNELSDLDVRIGGSIYRIRMGGLHSSEKSRYFISDDKFVLKDFDVTSYYPSIIINLNLFPKQCGFAFIDAFKGFKEKRVLAKRTEDVVTAGSLKIVLNSGFGKMGSMFSNLYSPELLLSVTISGQLFLLMLIELIEAKGIEVVSANTDGIVVNCPRGREKELQGYISMWEKHTKFEMDETIYDAIYYKDVNSYIAVKKSSYKTKSCFLIPESSWFALQKNPQNLICNEALCEYLAKGIPIEQTIHSCKDITKFVTVRAVRGGSHKDGWFIGKVVRFYYATNIKGSIKYVTSGNSAPESEGAKPLMELPNTFPTDINYTWYINECNKMLQEIGFKQLSLF